VTAGGGAERPLSVGELTRRVKGALEAGFPDLWVAGEISNLTRARSGHVYLTLKDDSATLSAVIWRSTAGRLRFDLEEGMELLVRGGIDVYPPRGQYQLIVRKAEPRGVGALQLAFEKMRARLEAEGLFDPARKKPIPFLPRTIGVVTSPTGAAFRDILKVLGRRFPGVTVLLFPSLVQGRGAAENVARGIRALDGREGVDVLIVGRGGGSLEDLWAFNEEPVARAIAECGTPVISAVGHEVDVSIADLVADVRAPTPSAAAEIAVPSREDLAATIDNYARRGRAGVRNALGIRRERLRSLVRSWGVRSVPDRIRELAQRLDETARRLGTAADGVVRTARERVADLAARSEALSPLRVLARGYSVTTREDGTAPLRDAAVLEEGERIRTRLERGRVFSRVEGTEVGE